MIIGFSLSDKSVYFLKNKVYINSEGMFISHPKTCLERGNGRERERERNIYVSEKD